MQTRPDVMILDTDRNRTKSLRRILRESRSDLLVEEISDAGSVRESILTRRPRLVLLHSTFPAPDGDCASLLELTRHTNLGVMLVLPISGSLLYRSGYQDGMEMLDQADDIITTDFTSYMVQSVVVNYLDRRAVRQEAAEVVGAVQPELAFAPIKRI